MVGLEVHRKPLAAEDTIPLLQKGAKVNLMADTLAVKEEIVRKALTPLIEVQIIMEEMAAEAVQEALFSLVRNIREQKMMG